MIWPNGTHTQGIVCCNRGDHEWTAANDTRHKRSEEWKRGEMQRSCEGSEYETEPSNVCLLCRAWRGAYGLEPTVEMYVAHTVEILREIRRVLRKDGVVFLNLGDSYASGGKSPKPKDLCLIPERVALAAQADGWWVRSRITWAKPNPMPESVTDRPTDADERIWMFTKSARYFWDAEAVKERATESTMTRVALAESRKDKADNQSNVVQVKRCESAAVARDIYANPTDHLVCTPRNGMRNLRNVWTFPTQPYSGAHFATFPEELPRRCIKAASRVGDLILDPFGGSGTTGRVAIELNRRAVLLDLAYTHEYRELADKRTRNVQRELVVATPPLAAGGESKF